MFFVLAVSIFGFALGIRTAERLIARNLIARSEMTKIGTGYVACVFVLMIFLPRSYLAIWFAVFLPLLALSILIVFLVRKRSTDFRNSLGAVLTLTALKMKAGRSFRQSFSEVASESAPRLRAKLSEIGSVVVFSQQKSMTQKGTDKPASERSTLSLERDAPLASSSAFVREVIDELIRIDRQPHSASKRLAVFRDKLRMEEDFRRRSGQVLARIRAQSFIMTALYVALAVFIACKFGWHNNVRIFAYSAALFTAGALWIWRGGRSLKWKV